MCAFDERQPTEGTAPVKQSARLIPLLELLFFVSFALITKELADPYIWRFAGPVTLISTLVLLTLYLRWRGETWATMGLPGLPGARAKLMVLPKALGVFAAFAAAVAFVMFVGPYLGIDFSTEPPGVQERWGDVEGNLPIYLLWLGIVWTSAAFGEEMFFRGFLITKLEAVFNDVRFATVFAVVLPALLFGFVHFYYQGLRGLLMTGMIGLAFGICFILFKRSLWPIILVHGVVDTIGFTGRYLGLE
jgi:membrane protease YdiL (CAAX protease family)